MICQPCAVEVILGLLCLQASPPDVRVRAAAAGLELPRLEQPAPVLQRATSWSKPSELPRPHLAYEIFQGALVCTVTSFKTAAVRRLTAVEEKLVGELKVINVSRSMCIAPPSSKKGVS